MIGKFQIFIFLSYPRGLKTSSIHYKINSLIYVRMYAYTIYKYNYLVETAKAIKQDEQVFGLF